MEGSRLRAARKALSLSADELGVQLGVSGATVSRWEKNIHEPDDETKKRLAIVLNISIAYLMGEEETSVDALQASQNDIIELTVYDISTVVACEMELAPLHSSKGVEIMFTVKDSFADYDMKRPPFAVIMPNESMRGAGIYENDIVVINPVETAESGKPAFVIYNGAGLIRWVLKKADGSIELQTANTDYASIIVEPEYVNDAYKFRVVGKIVEILSRKKPKDAF